MNERDSDLDRLESEVERNGLVGLDLMTTTELVGLMNREDAVVPGAVAPAHDQIVLAIDGIVDQLTGGGGPDSSM